MNPALSIACALLVADPAAPEAPPSQDRQEYRAARALAGRDPGANVALALWCEARGLDAERLNHLTLAVLADPSHAKARALLGMVLEGGRWGRPDPVAGRPGLDEARSAVRAEYQARRLKADGSADGHWKLARWCERAGLADEAMAHDVAVTRLDPSREDAWKKLGCKRFEGRWMTPERARAILADREAQALADRRWLPLLESWKDGLSKPGRRAEAERGLLGVTDPRAVRSIARAFGSGSAKDQGVAVRLLGQVDSTEASRRLAALAVFGELEEVRRSAIETLRHRDLRGALEPVIALLRAPVKFVARPVEGPDSPGFLAIEGPDAIVERFYPTPAIAPPRDPARLPGLIARATDQANRRFADDVMALAATNRAIEATNKNALAALDGVTGKKFGPDPLAWLAWWTDKKGYAFQAPAPTNSTAGKPTIVQILEAYELPHNACFAAGTPVRTLDGPRPIETIRVGDRLLTQDPTTGALSYQPALAVFHNPPAATLRLVVGGEEVVATGIHRFWKAGQGWAMARDLKPGDPIRGLGRVARVESIAPDSVQPVFNIEVARGDSFFVGPTGLLVHDNHLVESVARPFDAPPDPATIEAPR